MRWNQTLTLLRNTLANLYPTRESSYRVVDEAAIPREHITFSDEPINNWHAILREAHLRKKVRAIINVACKEYGENEALRAVDQTYLDNFSYLTSVSPTHPDKVDLAIVTAMPEELEPVLNLIGGRDHWKSFTLDKFVHYCSRFELGSQSFTVVACSLWKYGGNPTTAEVLRLKPLQPQLIAMTGICAGWEAEGVHLGDVIFADRAFHPGEGKETSSGFQPDTQTYQPPPWLTQWLKDFSRDQQWHGEINTPRPLSLRYQAQWILCQMYGRKTPYPLTDEDWREIRTNQIDFPRVKNLLIVNKLITKNGKLQKRALPLLDELREKNHGELKPLPDPERPSVHYGAFASTEAISAIGDPFFEYAKPMRKVRSIELEVASLFSAAAEIEAVAFAVKGVSDHGTRDKDDVFHAYAAEAAARWMYAFIRQYAHHLSADDFTNITR